MLLPIGFSFIESRGFFLYSALSSASMIGSPLSRHFDSNGYLSPCGGESNSKKIEYMCVLNDIEYDNIKDLIDELYWC